MSRQKNLSRVCRESNPLKIPFQDGSLTAEAFIRAQAGVSIEELADYVRKSGGDPRRILRILRSGERGSKRWAVKESGGKLKLEYPI